MDYLLLIEKCCTERYPDSGKHSPAGLEKKAVRLDEE